MRCDAVSVEASVVVEVDEWLGIVAARWRMNEREQGAADLASRESVLSDSDSANRRSVRLHWRFPSQFGAVPPHARADDRRCLTLDLFRSRWTERDNNCLDVV